MKPFNLKWRTKWTAMVLVFSLIFAQFGVISTVFANPSQGIEGSVKSAGNQEGLAGVQVNAFVIQDGVSSTSVTASTVTNESGTYLLGQLSVGVYKLEFVKTGFPTIDISEVSVTEGVMTTNNVTLSSETTTTTSTSSSNNVMGVVYNSDNPVTIVQGVEVQVYPADASNDIDPSGHDALNKVYTDVNGNFSLNLPVGNYELVVTGSPYYQMKEIPLVVTADATSNLSINLVRYPYLISGTVLGDNGTLTAGIPAMIALFNTGGTTGSDDQGEPDNMTFSGYDGQFIIGSMTSGGFRLIVKPDNEGTDTYLTKTVDSMFTSTNTNIDIGIITTVQGVKYTGQLVDANQNGVHGMVEVQSTSTTSDAQLIDFAFTDENGNFSVFVPNIGSFKLVIPDGTQNPIESEFPTLGNSFGNITVSDNYNTGGQEPNDIVQGKVFEADGVTAVVNAYMQYVQLDASGVEIEGTQIGEGTDMNGNFRFNPQVGKNYKIKQIEYSKSNIGNRIALNYRFTITSEGKMVRNGAETNNLIITLPAPNLVATFTDSGSPIADAWIEIEHLDSPAPWGGNERSYGQTDTNGVLRLSLSEGKLYKIISIGTKNFWQQTEVEFNIAEGEVKQLPIDLAGNANVEIKILKDGQPLTLDSSSYGIDVSSKTDYSKHFHKQINNSGVASFELTPGQYEVSGLSVNNNGTFEWINVNQVFDVTAAHTKDSHLVVTVNLKEPNVSGTLSGTDSAAIRNAWLQFRSIPSSANETMQHYGTSTNDSGSYKINLPAGKYEVEGFRKWDSQTNTGGFTQLGIEIIVSGETQTINLQVPTPNLSGRVFKSGGTIAWSDVELIFAPADLTQEQQQNSYMLEKRTKTADDGSYSLFLSDGSYVLKAIASPTRWVEMNNAFRFNVVNGIVNNPVGFTVDGNNYNIIPPSGNVTGTIINFDGSVLTTGSSVRRAWVNVGTDWSKQTSTDKSETNGTATATATAWKWYGAEVQENGSFELFIDTPGYYEVQGVGIEGVDLNGNSTWRNIEIHKPFHVESSTQAVSLGYVGTNVKGKAQLEGQDVAFGGVVVRPRGLTQEQMQEPWKFDKWASTNAQGEFEMYLDPGNYEVFSISGSGRWVEIHHNFTVTAPVNGQTSIGTNLGTIAVTSNVWGTVKNKDGQPLRNGWMDIRKIASDSTEQYLGAQTDDSGAFKTSLADGNYVIKGVGSSNGHMSLTYPFKVDNNLMKTMDNVTLDSIDIQPNIIGVAKEDLSSTALIADAWITIKPADASESDWANAIWVNTDETGTFGTFLAPGEYKVVNLGSPTFWKQLDIKFSVNSNGVLQAASGFEANVAGNQLIVAAPAPNLKGVVKDKDNNLMTKAWVQVRVDDGTSGWDSAKYFGFSTNDEGKFSGKLAAGNYIVVSVSNQEGWKEYNIPFSISQSDQLIGNTVVGGELIVKPQKPNVVGIVKDKDGNLVTGGWLSIKPASAGENDWSTSKGTETNSNGAFEMYLPAGDYIVAHAGNSTTWVDARTPFTIEADGVTLTSSRQGALLDNGLIVAPPQPNVTGSIFSNKSGDGEDQKVVNGWFSIVRIDKNNNILDRNGNIATITEDSTIRNITVSDRQNIWTQSFWYNSNADGDFAINLEPGTYYVLYAGGPTTGFEPGTVFSVTANANTSTNIRPAGDNFTGTITGLVQEQLVQSYVQYWVQVVDANDTSETPRTWWIPVQDDGDAITNGTGKFSFSLPLGTYKILSINTPFGFNAMSGLDAASYEITPNAAVTKDIDLTTQIKVKGQVTRNTFDLDTIATVMLIEIDDSDSNSATKELIQTDAKGKFAFIRKVGFTYKIEKIATDSWHTVDDANTSTADLDPISVNGSYDVTQALNVNYSE